MSRATPATRALDAAGVVYRLHQYDYDADAANIGRHAAAALGVEPARLLKTLMLELDGKPACAVLPVDQALSLKRFAAALGGKHAAMLPVPRAERITGYRVGGISPFGQKKRVPTLLDASALGFASILCNGGQRGLQVELDPHALLRVLEARATEIASQG